MKKQQIDTGASYIWKKTNSEASIEKWKSLDEAVKEPWRQILKESIKFSRNVSYISKDISPFGEIDFTLENDEFKTSVRITIQEEEKDK